MNPLQVATCSSLDRYRTHIVPYLRLHETENNLLLGLLARSDSPFPILSVVTEKSRPIMAAIQTDPSMNLLLSFSHRADAADLLARTLIDQRIQLPGVMGLEGLVERFVDVWRQHTKTLAHIEVQERIYAIHEITRDTREQGTVRWATARDFDWLVQWTQDFTREAMPEASVDRVPAMVEHKMKPGLPEAGWIIVEIDGTPVSLAGFGGPTGSGVRVGPVYTPQQWRQRGYGTQAVRELTARLFELGYQSVFLFTDRANPTSNRIYQKIGYRAVADVTQYRFNA